MLPQVGSEALRTLKMVPSLEIEKGNEGTLILVVQAEVSESTPRTRRGVMSGVSSREHRDIFAHGQ